jgi:hypothetical protein
MKRNLKTVFKFLLLSAVTVVFTVLLFRIFSIRSTFEKEVGLPVDAPQVRVIRNEKIDWHDYEAVRRDALRRGDWHKGCGVIETGVLQVRGSRASRLI